RSSQIRRAAIGFRTTGPVGSASNRRTLGHTVKRTCKAPQRFSGATAATRATHRDRGFTAGDQDAWLAKRLIMLLHLLRDSGMHQADITRLALDAVGQDIRCDAGCACGGRCSLQRMLGRRNDVMAVA